ncbi:hypothetical protein L208DRAFT_1381884 [Tricholoma matsutake]|nr:hypothetical protein L208DRAFT_1381884 [Tricholoma matsutake 945]
MAKTAAPAQPATSKTTKATTPNIRATNNTTDKTSSHGGHPSKKKSAKENSDTLETHCNEMTGTTNQSQVRLLGMSSQINRRIRLFLKSLHGSKLAAVTKGTDQDETIPIAKPHGEAGDKKWGFNLQEVMGLSNDDALYKTILCFPGDWAITKIMKQYLQNQHKQNKCKLKLAACTIGGGKDKKGEDDEDDEDNNNESSDHDEPCCKKQKSCHINNLSGEE